jgi:hypothetical protein
MYYQNVALYCPANAISAGAGETADLFIFS